MSSNDFVNKLKGDSSILLYLVEEAEIDSIQNNLEREPLKTVPGTMRLHQIVTDQPKHIRYRDVSCICEQGSNHANHDFQVYEFDTGNKIDSKKKRKSKKEDTKDDRLLKKIKKKCGMEAKESTRYVNQFAEHLKSFQKCKTFDQLVSKCRNTALNDVSGQPRRVIEGFRVHNQALDLWPDDVPYKAIRLPVMVRADGDCLPGSGSVFVFGNDSHADEIRVRIVSELALNSQFYLDENNLVKGLPEEGNSHHIKKAFAMYSEEYEAGSVLTDTVIERIFQQELLKITKPKTYMGIWQLFALASVLKMPIFSMYPNKGNPVVRKHLHRIVLPRERQRDDIAYIMWSSTRNDMIDQAWIPNHFVPVLDTENKVASTNNDNNTNFEIDELFANEDVNFHQNETSDNTDSSYQESSGPDMKGVVMQGRESGKNEDKKSKCTVHLENKEVNECFNECMESPENKEVVNECIKSIENREDRGRIEKTDACENAGARLVANNENNEGRISRINKSKRDEGADGVQNKDAGDAENKTERDEITNDVENKNKRSEGAQNTEEGKRDNSTDCVENESEKHKDAEDKIKRDERTDSVENKGAEKANEKGKRDESTDSLENESEIQEDAENAENKEQRDDKSDFVGIGRERNEIAENADDKGEREEDIDFVENESERKEGPEDTFERNKGADVVENKSADVKGEKDEDESCFDLGEIPPPENCLGKHVVVQYDGELYPGVVINVGSNDLYVQCMHKVGKLDNCFFWPRYRKDQCWYQYQNVLAIIPKPVKKAGSNSHFIVSPQIWKNIQKLMNKT